MVFHSTVFHSTVFHSTVFHSTVFHSTVFHSMGFAEPIGDGAREVIEPNGKQRKESVS